MHKRTLLWKLMWIKRLGGSPSWMWDTVTGNAPLSLPSAKAYAIKSLTQTGLCKQSNFQTPSPETPGGIVCNNGWLEMVDSELPSGYKRVLGFTCNNNAMWEIDGFHLKGSDTVRISFSVNAACNVFGCYQGADATDNYDLYVSTTSNSKYFRYGNGTYLSYWSAADLGQRFDVVYTPNGSTGMPQDSTWSPLTFTSANDLLIGSTTTTGTSSKLKGNLYGNFVVDGRLKLIPCERQSDYVLGYYDTYSGTFYEPYSGFDGAVSLGYDNTNLVLGTVGTTEVLTVAPVGDVASVQNLYSAGTFADTQDIISGLVTRRCGVVVFDGTEEGWSGSTYTGDIFRAYIGGFWNGGTENRYEIISTHFKYGSGNANGIGFLAKSGHIFLEISDSIVNSTNAWKAWLASEYASGYPVIVVYPLGEETTEQVTPQPISTAEGSNTISATAAISPIALECEYAKAL